MGWCKWIGCLSQTKGDYCYIHTQRKGLTSAQDREATDESITVTESRSVMKRKYTPKPLTVAEKKQVAEAERIVRETIQASIAPPPLTVNGRADIICQTAEQAIEVQRKIHEPEAKYLEPVGITYVVQLDTLDAWTAFTETWKARHPTYRICHFNEEDNNPLVYMIILEPSKPSPPPPDPPPASYNSGSSPARS